jgi:hypothetical protein
MRKLRPELSKLTCLDTEYSGTIPAYISSVRNLFVKLNSDSCCIKLLTTVIINAVM